jgi:hypothetical protein
MIFQRRLGCNSGTAGQALWIPAVGEDQTSEGDPAQNLIRGETPAQVAQDVMNYKDVVSSSNLDAYHAGFFVGASIAAYCPKYVGRI